MIRVAVSAAALWTLLVGSTVFADGAPMKRLKVSDDGRRFVHEDGTPFFYLADTAWELFHRLDRAEAERYAPRPNGI